MTNAQEIEKIVVFCESIVRDIHELDDKVYNVFLMLSLCGFLEFVCIIFINMYFLFTLIVPLWFFWRRFNILQRRIERKLTCLPNTIDYFKNIIEKMSMSVVVKSSFNIRMSLVQSFYSDRINT